MKGVAVTCIKLFNLDFVYYFMYLLLKGIEEVSSNLETGDYLVPLVS